MFQCRSNQPHTVGIDTVVTQIEFRDPTIGMLKRTSNTCYTFTINLVVRQVECCDTRSQLLKSIRNVQ